MSKRRKVWLTLASVVAAMVIAVVTALYILGRDERPPDDSMLIVQRLDIPDEENGLTYLTQAAGVVCWPGNKVWREAGLQVARPGEADPDNPGATTTEDDAKIDAMLAGRQWDADLAAEILDHNVKSLELVRKAAECQYMQRARPTGIEGALSDDVGDELNLAKVMVLQAQALARKGQDEAALEQALEVVRLGHAMENSKGCLVPFLVGMTTKGMGLDAVQSLLKSSTVPPDRLKALADRLAASADNGPGLADSIRVEYQWGTDLADQTIRQAEDKVADQRGMTPQEVRQWSSLSWFGLLYRPQETRRLFIEGYRPVVEAAPKPFSEVHLPDPRVERNKGLFERILQGNVLGRGMRDIILPAIASLPRLKSRSNTAAAATQALIALKAYKAKTGRLPQTLDELVPEFLPAVPLDDFDGKPMRYSRDKKVVYSVGEDFKDDGGMTREESRAWWNENKRTAEEGPLAEDDEPNVWDLPDPSFPINF